MQDELRVAFHTLGCKLNFSETATLTRQFEDRSFVTTPFNTFADVYVLNTCSVTENADKECRQLVRKVLKQNPNALVIVTGCYAQLKPEEVSNIPGVDYVLGAKEKFHLFEYIKDFEKRDYGHAFVGGIDEMETFEASFSTEERTRAFLKVQDGCDYPCTYCTIPLARGKSRSATLNQVVTLAQLLKEKGHQEIVLTGVNIGTFETDKGEDFFDLVKALDATGIPRIRISSIEPNLLRDEIIDFVANSQSFVPHFHIPLQSGSPKILRLMRRRYKREVFESRIYKIKERMPDACIGVDVIVGFPQESDEDFQETYEFLHSLPISYLHVFSYSARANTPAATMEGQVPESLKQVRSRTLRNLSSKKKHAFSQPFEGQIRKVLIEQKLKDDKILGLADNYLKVWLPIDEAQVLEKQIIKAKLVKHLGEDNFVGTIMIN